MTIYERIFTLRRAAGLSQEALAERVGVSRQAIGKWENGAALPGLDNLQALAAALGVSCNELLTGEATRRDAAPAAAAVPADGNQDAALHTAGLTDVGLWALLEAYDTAQKQDARRQRLLLVSLAAVLLVLICLGIFADVRLRVLADRVDLLSGRMNSIDQRIDDRIGSIRTEIEQSLNESERIVADYDWEYRMISDEEIELALTVTPRSRREGTAAEFSVIPAGGAVLSARAVSRMDGVFTAQLKIPLTEEYESFAVMAAFTTDGETQSQMLFREYNFYSSRRTTADLTLTDFRATVLSPNTRDARLSLGGECGLEIRRAEGEGTPVPVSAEVALLVDGQSVAVQPVDLSYAFTQPGQLIGSPDPVTESAAISGTWYVRFEPLEIPVPRTGAALEATVTDSSGKTIVCRQEVYRP